MDSTIVAALIGGLFTVAASIATFIITRIVESDAWSTRHVKQIALDGRWEATLHQEAGPEGPPIDFPGFFVFKTKHRTIQGVADLEITLQKRTLSTSYAFEGRFVHGRFLKLDYHIKDQPDVIHFGFMLLELSPDGYSLNGHFLGFGALSQRVVWGSAQIHKPGTFYAQSVKP